MREGGSSAWHSQFLRTLPGAPSPTAKRARCLGQLCPPPRVKGVPLGRNLGGEGGEGSHTDSFPPPLGLQMP